MGTLDSGERRENGDLRLTDDEGGSNRRNRMSDQTRYAAERNPTEDVGDPEASSESDSPVDRPVLIGGTAFLLLASARMWTLFIDEPHYGYSVGVDDALAQKDTTAHLRVEGTLEKDSIEFRPKPCESPRAARPSALEARRRTPDRCR
ncbi:MAG: hypothetical protein AAGF12_22750 [Myxococcota bacterium]